MSRLLIIVPSALHHFTFSLQVAHSLRQQVKGLEIDCLVRDVFAPLARMSTAIDTVYEFKRQGGTASFLGLMKEVRKTKYDYVFDFEGLLRSGALTWRALGTRKVGRSDAREGATIFYDEKVPLPAGGKRGHVLDILLQFCPVLGAKPELRGPLEFRSGENLKLSFLGEIGAKPHYVIFPESRKPGKAWPHFKLLTALFLKNDRQTRIIWAGDKYVPDKNSFPASRFLNLTGNTSIVSLPALISRASWVIANDSGPLHLAAALGVPTLGIFGPTDPQLFGPYPLNAPTNHVVQAPAGNLQLLPVRDVYNRLKKLDAPRGRTAHPFPPRT